MSTFRQLEGEDAVRAAQYIGEARHLAEQLPSDVRDHWLISRATDVVVRKRTSTISLKPRKPTGLISPATECMWLSSGLRGMALGSGLSPPITSFKELISRENVVRLLKGPLGEKGLRTQVIILRGLASVAERALGTDVSYIHRAVSRIRSRANRSVAPDLQRPFSDFWDVAHELAPYMIPGDPHELETARQSRYAATLGIALQLIPRRSELTGLNMSNVLIDRDHRVVDVVVPEALRKDGSSYQCRLSPSIAALVIDYAMHARPFLLNHGGIETDKFWVSSTGGALCPEGVVETLRRQVARVLGNTASCLIFRRATASRLDINENETFLWLHQEPSSRVGQEVYAQRDLAQGQRALLSAWGTV